MNLFRTRKRQPKIVGEVETISGDILIVDPAWLPTELVHELTHAAGDNPVARGVIAYVDGDGIYQVFRNPNGSLFID